jgi:hypothetical protein
MQVSPATFGRKLGWICRASSFLQFIGLNHLWFFISSLPPGPLPSRLLGSLCSSWKLVGIETVSSDQANDSMLVKMMTARGVNVKAYAFQEGMSFT